jgi:hypothetical protein
MFSTGIKMKNLTGGGFYGSFLRRDATCVIEGNMLS